MRRWYDTKRVGTLVCVHNKNGVATVAASMGLLSLGKAVSDTSSTLAALDPLRAPPPKQPSKHELPAMRYGLLLCLSDSIVHGAHPGRLWAPQRR